MGELFYFPGKIIICLYNRYEIRQGLTNVGTKYYENLLDIREIYKCSMNNISKYYTWNIVGLPLSLSTYLYACFIIETI